MLAKVTVVKIANYGTSVCGDVAAAINIKTAATCFGVTVTPSFFFKMQFVSFLTYLVSVLFTFYIQDVLKFKKIIPAPKG